MNTKSENKVIDAAVEVVSNINAVIVTLDREKLIGRGLTITVKELDILNEAQRIASRIAKDTLDEQTDRIHFR